MERTSRSAGHRRPYARLAAAATLAAGACLGLGTGVATADPGNGNGNAYGLTQGNGTAQAPGLTGTSPAAPAAQPAQSNAQGNPPSNPQGNAQGPGKDKAKHQDKAQDKAKDKGRDAGKGGAGNGTGDRAHQATSGQQANRGGGTKDQQSGQGTGQASAPADPPGNNGTVKIAPLGEIDSIPDNSPHPGCSFVVEWYGFDEGADVVSRVAFTEQAPTTDVGMTVSGPGEVFVGGDPASGAGTDSGLDGRETYTLSFTGAPHPKQGYHVRLTVATPRSHGNDTKTKVFWVQDCRPGGEAPATEQGSPGHATPSQAHGSGPHKDGGKDRNKDAGKDRPSDVEVLGEQAVSTPASGAPAAASQALPTAVNAGAVGAALSDTTGTTTLLGLALLALAGVCARLGWRRRRA